MCFIIDARYREPRRQGNRMRRGEARGEREGCASDCWLWRLLFPPSKFSCHTSLTWRLVLRLAKTPQCFSLFFLFCFCFVFVSCSLFLYVSEPRHLGYDLFVVVVCVCVCVCVLCVCFFFFFWARKGRLHSFYQKSPLRSRDSPTTPICDAHHLYKEEIAKKKKARYIKDKCDQRNGEPQFVFKP